MRNTQGRLPKTTTAFCGKGGLVHQPSEVEKYSCRPFTELNEALKMALCQLHVRIKYLQCVPEENSSCIVLSHKFNFLNRFCQAETPLSPGIISILSPHSLQKLGILFLQVVFFWNFYSFCRSQGDKVIFQLYSVKLPWGLVNGAL